MIDNMIVALRALIQKLKEKENSEMASEVEGAVSQAERAIGR